MWTCLHFVPPASGPAHLVNRHRLPVSSLLMSSKGVRFFSFSLHYLKACVLPLGVLYPLSHLCCSSELIQTEDLCIERGKVTHMYLFNNHELKMIYHVHFFNAVINDLDCLQLCWVLYCDIMCLDYDGNLLDACVISLLAALKNSMWCQTLC